MNGQISAMITVAAAMLSATIHATTYYWANTGALDGDLGSLRNWTTGSTAGSNNPEAFAAADVYTVRHASKLPTGMSNWYLSADLDMLGTFTTTKSESSTAAPYECVVNLGGRTLTAKAVQSRGTMVFTNGTLSAASVKAGHDSGNVGGTITFGKGATATLNGISYLDTSDNAVNVVDGATVTVSSVVEIGNIRNSNNNVLRISGNGSKIASTANMRVAYSNYDDSTPWGNKIIVSDGGALSISALVIGGANNSTGNSVTVEGGGSSITASGTTYVGGNANTNVVGNLYVLDGATFSGAEVVIGKKSLNQEVCVSNAVLAANGKFQMGGQSTSSSNHGGTNATLRIAGENPSVTVNGDGIYVYAPSKMIFDMPKKGWSTAPVQVAKSGKTINFPLDVASLEITVNAEHVEPGTYTLISTTGSMTDTVLAKISLSAESTGNVELVKTATSIGAKVKPAGLRIIFK